MDGVGWHGVANGQMLGANAQTMGFGDLSGAEGGAGGPSGNGGHSAQRGGNGHVGTMQESVNRLSALSMGNQGCFGQVGMGGGPGQNKDTDIMQRKGRMIQGQQQLGGKGAGLPGLHPENEYTDQLLSELQWAQQAPQMHGGQLPSYNCMVSPSSVEFTSQLPPALGGGGAHAPSQHAAYDIAGLKRDMLPGQLGGGRMQYGNSMPGNTPHLDSMGMLGGAGGKRPRGMAMVGPHGGGMDPYMMMAGGGGQPGAHKDALMELARENLILKHQLQVATLEVTRLRQVCEKYQQDVEESGDSGKNSQSRYWTDEEHHRFLEAIQKFGHKDVKAISSFVGSRNATQVRTHAQKYFMRLARSSKQGGDSLRAFDIGGGSSEAGGTDLDSECTSNRRSVSGGESGTSAAAAAAFMAKAGHVHQSSRHDDMNIMNENPSSAKLSGAQSHGQQSSRHGGSGKSTGGHGAKQQQMQQHFEQHNDEQQLQQQHRHEKLQLQQKQQREQQMLVHQQQRQQQHHQQQLQDSHQDQHRDQEQQDYNRNLQQISADNSNNKREQSEGETSGVLSRVKKRLEKKPSFSGKDRRSSKHGQAGGTSPSDSTGSAGSSSEGTRSNPADRTDSNSSNAGTAPRGSCPKNSTSSGSGGSTSPMRMGTCNSGGNSNSGGGDSRAGSDNGFLGEDDVFDQCVDA